MENISLSVVIPNYNHGKYISRAIEAIVSQSRQPDELIIVDDGSTDNSPEIIESYAQRYSYIHFIRNNHNKGSVASFNQGVKIASGDYIHGAAADDYVLPGFFEKAMKMAEHYTQAGIICGKVLVIDLEGRELYELKASRWTEPLFASPEAYMRDFINAESPSEALGAATLYKRGYLEEVGYFREELHSLSDFFASRSIALKYGVCYIPERFKVWTHNPEGVFLSSFSNPKVILDILAYASRLMQSPEFRDRFPEAHVKQWETNYRKFIINKYEQNTNKLFNRAKEPFNYGFSLGSQIDKLIICLMLKCLGLCRRVLLARLKYIINNYSGDISY